MKLKQFVGTLPIIDYSGTLEDNFEHVSLHNVIILIYSKDSAP